MITKSLLILPLFLSISAIAYGAEVSLTGGSSVTIKANEETTVTCQANSLLPSCMPKQRLDPVLGNCTDILVGEKAVGICWSSVEGAIGDIKKMRSAGICR